MNKKIADQIKEDEMVSDEALEAAAMKEGGAGGWTFVCTIDCNVIEPGP